MNQANYSIEEDVFGTCLNIKVDISLYSLAAIMKSTYWFTDKCFLYIHWADEEKQILTVSFRGKDDLNINVLHSIAGEFMNSVLGKLFKNPCSQAELNKIVPFGFSLQRQKMVFFLPSK